MPIRLALRNSAVGEAARRRTRRALALLGVLSFAVMLMTGPPSLVELQSHVRAFGWAAPVAFVLVYGLLMLLPVPRGALSVLGGALFGWALGGMLAVLGAALGGVAAFAVARHLLGNPLWTGRAGVRRIEKLLAARGMWPVLGARLLPFMPFTIASYVFGSTSISLRTYALGTLLGAFPSSLLLAGAGASGAAALT